MRDQNTFWLRSRAGSENDLREIVAGNGNLRWIAGLCRRPLKIAEAPDRGGGIQEFGNDVAREDSPGLDNSGDAASELSGTVIVNRGGDHAFKHATPESCNPLRPVF